MAYGISAQAAGVDFTAQTATAQFNLGREETGSDGNVYIYVQFNVTTGVNGASLVMQEDFKVTNLTTSTAGSNPQRVVFAQTPIATSGTYGWCISHGGSFLVNTNASCAADVKLYTTTTGGRINDNASGTVLIEGLRATATQGGGAGDLAATATGPVTVNTQS